MSDVTRILCQIKQGDDQAAEQLLPLVYEELRKLAAAKMAQEKPGQTLQATALVHEAHLRLVDSDESRQWDSRGHFNGALLKLYWRQCRPFDTGGVILAQNTGKQAAVISKIIQVQNMGGGSAEHGKSPSLLGIR